MARTFEAEWADKVRHVRASDFWRYVSSPPSGRIVPQKARKGRDETEVDSSWAVSWEPELPDGGPARIGIEDLRRFLGERLGIRLRHSRDSTRAPRILFCLQGGGLSSDPWESRFDLRVHAAGIDVVAATEEALLRASLYLSNYWSLKRAAQLAPGRRRVRPLVRLLIGADLWGGFSTTQAWVHGREEDANWLELARMGVNAVPVMILLEDYLDPDPSGPFASLRNPLAKEHRARLAKLARQSARFGVRIMLMGYNPKLQADHPVFAAHPDSRGTLQAGGAFRALCSSDPETLSFLSRSWASFFEEIPELGGLLAITGGEGFYHCFMRSAPGAADCPRCSRRTGTETVAELVNGVARGIHASSAHARVLTWPYSAGHWSHDRDQIDFIRRLDPEHVIFQTEVDKDSVDWRDAGYAKNIWDYSMSTVTPSDRCLSQRAEARRRSLPFSVKIECNNSIECLNVPYLPALENQLRIWGNARRLRPEAIHCRWLFDGSCKSPSEELGYWTIWGAGTELDDPDAVLQAIARRDFGVRAAPAVRRAWKLFSEALRHHPMLDYYRGTFFVGPAQPLVLEPEPAPSSLDPAFYGRFYWLWESSSTSDMSAFEQGRPLFYSRPFFRAIVRRGPRAGQDVALEELQAMASLWERGVEALSGAKALVPASCRARYSRELTLARHLGLTWRSGANVEEFLRVRDRLQEFSHQSWVRSGHLRENLSDLERLRSIARHELRIAREDLKLVHDVDYLDLGLRMDMGTATTTEMLQAKIRQIEALLAVELPRLSGELRRF